MTETEPMVASMWDFMASWFTPTILFCVMNLMIGTIYISSNFKSQNKQQQQQQQHSEDHSPQLVPKPSLLERVRSINFSLYRSEHHDSSSGPFTRHTNSQADQTPDRNPSQGDDHHVIRSKSVAIGETPAMVPVKMKKSASESSAVAGFDDAEITDPQRPWTERERKTKGSESTSSGEDEEVDAKADDFISRFKQQLKLQRLDSLLRVTDMLKRGA